MSAVAFCGRNSLKGKGRVQLSLDKSRDPVRLEITAAVDPIADQTVLQVLVKNRQGDVIHSIGRHLRNDQEAELLPQLLHLIALNWLFADGSAIVRDVASFIQQARRGENLMP